MNDSNFHLVKRNGKLELVKLEPVKKKSKPKDLKQSKTGECHKAVLKTYSRIRKKSVDPLLICQEKKEANQAIEPATVDVPDIKAVLIPVKMEKESSTVQAATVDMPDVKPVLISLNEVGESCTIQTETVDMPDVKPVSIPSKENEDSSAIQAVTIDVPYVKPLLIHSNGMEESFDVQTGTVDASAAIKTELELDIVDEERQEPESIEESIKVDDIENRTEPSVDPVISAKKSIQIVKVTDSNVINSIRNVNSLSTIPNLVELELKPVKCNVCGMIFPKSDNQVTMLGKHFFKHKTSVVNVVKKQKTFYTYHKKEKLLLEPYRHSKEPIILNSLLKHRPEPLTYLAIVPVTKTYVSPAMRKETERRSTTELSDSPISLKRRFDAESPPNDILNRLRSCQSDHEKSHVVIGSTLIKPIKQSTTVGPVNVELILSSETNSPELNSHADMDTSDADDDVEIVEEKPELIVIDDNDELDIPNENVQ